MSFSFKPGDRSVANGVRRIAAEQIELALFELNDGEIPRDEAIHGVRKRCKKLRGLIRIAAADLRSFKKENAAIRDAARSLAGQRDADVMLATLDRLGAEAEDEATAKLLGKIHAHLKADMEDGTSQAPPLEAFAGRLRKIGKRVRGWQVKSGRRALPRGLRTTYASGRAAMAKARKRPSPEELHEWRKHVKYHLYHLLLLKPAAPRMLAAPARLARVLSEGLGDHHDLSVLRDRVMDTGILTDPRERDRFVGLIEARKDALMAEAFRRGAILYAETPKALARRIGVYWGAYWSNTSVPRSLPAAAE